MKDYQVSKIIISLYYCSLSLYYSLAMITQFDIDTYHTYLDITSKFCTHL